jgi:hypothetical protein
LIGSTFSTVTFTPEDEPNGFLENRVERFTICAGDH